MDKNLADMRMEYDQPRFDRGDAADDPIVQFEKWFDDLLKTGTDDPNSMTLATSSEDGNPSARVVLLKGIEGGNFIFYTNYQSQKGLEMEANPRVALNFYWPQLHRQVRVNGLVQRVDEKMSTAYFQSRPRDSQISAWASPQSTPVESREILEERFKELEQRFRGKDRIERPRQWGGYAVTPYRMEFWQGRPNRLHDRIVYTLNRDQGWNIRRLAP